MDRYFEPHSMKALQKVVHCYKIGSRSFCYDTIKYSAQVQNFFAVFRSLFLCFYFGVEELLLLLSFLSESTEIDITLNRYPNLRDLPTLVFSFLKHPLLRPLSQHSADYWIFLQCLYTTYVSQNPLFTRMSLFSLDEILTNFVSS